MRDPIDTCVDRETWWPLQVDTYKPDVVVWDAALYDSTDVYSGGRWVEFGSPEWDALYLAALDQARVAATGEGATFVLLGQNDFTALFTEEGYFVAKAGVDSRLVTVGVSPTGVTNIGAEIAANGTAA